MKIPGEAVTASSSNEAELEELDELLKGAKGQFKLGKEEALHLDPESKRLLASALRTMHHPHLPAPALRKCADQLHGKAKNAHTIWTDLKEEWKERAGDSHRLGKAVVQELKGKKPPHTNNPLREEVAALKKKGVLPEKAAELKSDLKKKEGTKEAVGEKSSTQQPIEGAAAAQVSLQGLDAGSVAGTSEATLTSQIDKIIEVFQKTSQYGAQLLSVQASALDSGETRISIALSNGVQVDIDLAQGGRDLNVYVRGLTAEQQKVLDTEKAHTRLRDALTERGFSVHLIQTERGEGEAFTGMGAPPREEQPQLLGETERPQRDESEEREGQHEQEEDEE